MVEYKVVDTLFPLLLREWEQSWVAATNSPGELKCRVEAAWGGGYATAEEMIAAMDEAGVETVFVTDLLAWSYKRQTRFAKDMTETIADLTMRYPGRIYGLADYDPLNIKESLRKLEADVKERNYKGVYIHIYGFDIPLDHRSMYPLYARCEELGVSVSMQTGHVLEAMPSEHGRPIYLDRIACDFPGLIIIGTHTGFPWVEELISVATKWPNVYISISAWLPKYFSPALINFMKSGLGRAKVLFGSNGLPWKRYLEQMKELDISEETKRMILYDNPKRVLGI
ncbi:amidohydrolase family protein [Chloroflexota bacterium]